MSAVQHVCFQACCLLGLSDTRGLPFNSENPSPFSRAQMDTAEKHENAVGF